MTRIVSFLLLLLAFAAFVAWGIYYAHTDLWWDEITSLEGYALVGLRTVLTTYPEPNNHVLFNLFNTLLLQTLRIHDLHGAMDRVAALRAAQWIVALGTGVYIVVTARRAFGALAGPLAGIFLVSTIPFLNFSMQLRGYNLSLFFVAGLLYHSVALLGPSRAGLVGRSREGPVGLSREGPVDRHRGGRREIGIHGAFVCVLTFALLFTLPSNVYFALSLAACALGFLVTDRSVRSPHVLLRARSFWLLAAIGLGAGIALLAYVPILDQVLHNRFVSQSPEERTFVLFRRLPPTLDHFLGGRWGLALLALPGIWVALRDRGRELPGSVWASPLLVLLFLPFFLSFLRNDAAFERTFVPLVPVFVVLLAASVSWTVATARRFGDRARALMVLGSGIYSLGTGVWLWAQVQDRLDRQFRETDRGEQNTLANSFQSQAFRPRESADWISKEIAADPGPVLLVHEADRVAWSRYLGRVDVPCYSLVSLSQADPAVAGEGMTHTGHFQYSGGTEEKLSYFGAHLYLPSLAEDDALAPLLQAVSRYSPSDRYYVVTDFPIWLPQLSRRLPQGWTWKRVRDTGGFGTVIVLIPPR